MNDLEIVAILYGDVGKRRARHDLEIAFDRDAVRIEPKLTEQVRNARAGLHPPVFPVHSNRKALVEGHCGGADRKLAGLAQSAAALPGALLALDVTTHLCKGTAATTAAH